MENLDAGTAPVETVATESHVENSPAPEAVEAKSEPVAFGSEAHDAKLMAIYDKHIPPRSARCLVHSAFDLRVGRRDHSGDLMTSWPIQFIDERDRHLANLVVSERLLEEIGFEPREAPPSYGFTANAYAFAVFASLNNADEISNLRDAADLAFEAFRAEPAPQLPTLRARHFLYVACFGVLADRTPDVARFLRSVSLPPKPLASEDWGTQVRGGVYRLWLLLLRKDGWPDLDALQSEIVSLREAQAGAEAQYLRAQTNANPRSSAWELIALYHLAKAAEILGTYSAQGSVGGSYDIREQLQSQFDSSILACERAELIDFHSTVRLLAATAERMVA